MGATFTIAPLFMGAMDMGARMDMGATYYFMTLGLVIFLDPAVEVVEMCPVAGVALDGVGATFTLVAL